MDDRANRVQHMAAGQIIAFGDFGRAGFFLVPLLAHDPGTFQPELYSCIGVDGVVDAAVTGHKTA